MSRFLGQFEQLEGRRVFAGELDPTFDMDGFLTTADIPHLESREGLANAKSLAVNDKIIVAFGGLGDPLYPGLSYSVARFNLDGSLDTLFGDNGVVSIDFGAEFSYVTSVAAMTDGRIVVAGGLHDTNGDRDIAVARLTTSGQLDASFGIGGKQTFDFGSAQEYQFLSGISLLPDGSVVAAGSIQLNSTGYDFAVAKLTIAGQLETTFGDNGKKTIDFGADEVSIGVDVTPDGSVVI